MDKLASIAGVPRGSSDEVVEEAVRRAALSATDFSWLSRGDHVLIKPVCNSGGDYPFTTDPVAVRAMIGLLKERGAGKVIVADMSGVQAVRFSKDSLSGSSRRLMEKNGLAQTARDAGAEVQAFEEAGWDAFHPEPPREQVHWASGVMMPHLVTQVDHIILMPRCGRHALAGSTLGLKAAVGWWRHDSRLHFHHRSGSLPEKAAEANTVPSLLDKQRLVLTSATKVLTTFGPDSGHVVEPDTGLIIASESILAHDMLSLSWLLENLRQTPSKIKNGFMADPHRSRFFTRMVNKMVIHWLGGSLAQAMSDDGPPNIASENIWDDRMLKRGFEVMGGIPSLDLDDATGALPTRLLRQLTEATRQPGSGRNEQRLPHRR